jgi:hypothetical protein
MQQDDRRTAAAGIQVEQPRSRHIGEAFAIRRGACLRSTE